MKLISALLLSVLLAGALSAQGSVNLGGSVNEDEQDFFLLEVDFGSTAQTITITVSIAATGGAAGLDVTLVDLDELCANGSALGIDSDFDPGTGTITLTMTPNRSGVSEFAVSVATDDAGTSPYAGTFSVDAGSATLSTSATYPFVLGVQQTFLARAQRFLLEAQAAINITQDFVIDVGATARTVQFYVESIAFGSGSFLVYEIDANGTEQLLTTLVGFDEANPTTSMRSGQVRLRIRTVAGSSGLYAWTCAMPTGVVVLGAYKSGGGGKKDEGCVAVAGAPLMPGALALAGLAAFRRRRRRLCQSSA